MTPKMQLQFLDAAERRQANLQEKQPSSGWRSITSLFAASLIPGLGVVRFVTPVSATNI